LPTPVNPDTYPTEVFLTENAPPAGFSTVSFPQVDTNLNLLSGWRAEISFLFSGSFARTSRETSAETRAEIWFNQIATARRVVFSRSGELFGEESTTFEAVRLGPDAFLVRDNVCLTNAGEDAASAADLNAGGLIGGVNHATPTGIHNILNNVEAWQYAFSAEDLVLPNVRPDTGGSIAFATLGEIWVAPAHNAVVRFYLTLEIENVFLFDRPLPVSGQLLVRYDLYDIGVVPNISVPFGC
jgi:hypothetical protein